MKQQILKNVLLISLLAPWISCPEGAMEPLPNDEGSFQARAAVSRRVDGDFSRTVQPATELEFVNGLIKLGLNKEHTINLRESMEYIAHFMSAKDLQNLSKMEFMRKCNETFRCFCFVCNRVNEIFRKEIDVYVIRNAGRSAEEVEAFYQANMHKIFLFLQKMTLELLNKVNGLKENKGMPKCFTNDRPFQSIDVPEGGVMFSSLGGTLYILQDKNGPVPDYVDNDFQIRGNVMHELSYGCYSKSSIMRS